MERRRRRGTRGRVGARALALALSTLGAGGALATAAAPQGCAGEVARGSAPAPIVVGVSLGLTQELATTCAPIRNAIRVAEGELNAGGGLLGRPLRFEIVDDKSDESSGVRRIAEDFAGRGVVAMIGPAGSEQVKATQEVLASAQIIQLVPAATSTELADIQPSKDRFLFRTTPADDFQASAVMLLASRTPYGLGADAGVAPPVPPAPTPTTCNRLALVYIDNAYGASMARVLAEEYPKLPGKSVVAETKIAVEAAASYEAEAAALVAKDPDCLAVISYEKAGAQFIRDLKAAPGYAALAAKGFFIIGTDGLFTQGFLDVARTDPGDPKSASIAEDVFGTNPDTQPPTSEYNAFRAIYASYFPLAAGEPTPPFAANAFDAAILIAFAIQKAGSVTDRVKIRDALRAVASAPGTPISPAEIGDGLRALGAGRDIDYKGASGKLDFEANGDVPGGFIVWQAARDPDKGVVFKTVSRFDEETLLQQAPP